MNWYLSAIKAATGFHTCSITELGFIRVSVITGLQPDIAAAKHALAALKGSPNLPFRLIPDDVGVAQLPAFVKKAQSVTDGSCATPTSSGIRRNGKFGEPLSAARAC